MFAESTHIVTVNYDTSLADMIKAGKYGWSSGYYNEQSFPVCGVGVRETEITLFHFNKDMSTFAVLDELKRHGFRAATLTELLALGASQPELQRGFAILALSSVWREPSSLRSVPSLGSNRVFGRELGLCWDMSTWGAYCRFAAVRVSDKKQ